EEDAIDAGRQQFRQLARELEGQRMAELERRRVIERSRLLPNGGGNLITAMTGVDTPQSGRTIEDLAAVIRGVVHVLGRDEHPWRALERTICGERHPELVERRLCGGDVGGRGFGGNGHDSGLRKGATM